MIFVNPRSLGFAKALLLPGAQTLLPDALSAVVALPVLCFQRHSNARHLSAVSMSGINACGPRAEGSSTRAVSMANSRLPGKVRFLRSPGQGLPRRDSVSVLVIDHIVWEFLAGAAAKCTENSCHHWRENE